MNIEKATRLHTKIMGKLHLPCRLAFSTDVKIGRHSFDDGGTCSITLNPEMDFKRPEHLILHEAAHHRCTLDALHGDLENALPEARYCCGGWSSGHCKHWADVLCEFYRITNIELPHATSFIEFAKAAGIERKNFAVEGESKTPVPHLTS